jgi:hypothetical protein
MNRILHGLLRHCQPTLFVTGQSGGCLHDTTLYGHYRPRRPDDVGQRPHGRDCGDEHCSFCGSAGKKLLPDRLHSRQHLLEVLTRSRRRVPRGRRSSQAGTAT